MMTNQGTGYFTELLCLFTATACLLLLLINTATYNPTGCFNQTAHGAVRRWFEAISIMNKPKGVMLVRDHAGT
jgi:hypothetical protein